jgi:hypothetical protein
LAAFIDAVKLFRVAILAFLDVGVFVVCHLWITPFFTRSSHSFR